MQAATNINLTPTQWEPFRGAVSDFLQGFGKDVSRVLRASDQRDLPRKIAKKRRSRVKSVNQQMQDILSPEQLPAYAVYRDTLLEKVDEQAQHRR